MKTQPALLLGAVSLLAVFSTWSSGVSTGIRGAGESMTLPGDTLDDLLNRQCIVTVDPLEVSTPVYAGSANKTTGFVAPNTVEGTVIRMDANWLVLREGNNQNWIPKNKIILIHICL